MVMMMVIMWKRFTGIFRQHHEKNGLLCWKRCVNEENRLEDVRDLKKKVFKLIINYLHLFYKTGQCRLSD